MSGSGQSRVDHSEVVSKLLPALHVGFLQLQASKPGQDLKTLDDKKKLDQVLGLRAEALYSAST